MVQQIYKDIKILEDEVRRLKGRIDRHFSGGSIIGLVGGGSSDANSALATIGKFFNNTASSLAEGDVVILDVMAEATCTDTVLASDTSALGVVKGDNGPWDVGELTPVLLLGNTSLVNVKGNVAAGDYLATSTTTNRAASIGADVEIGVFARAETAFIGDEGTVSAIVFPVITSSMILNYNKPGALEPVALSSKSDADVTSGFPGGIQPLVSLVELDDTGNGNGKHPVWVLGTSDGTIGIRILLDTVFGKGGSSTAVIDKGNSLLFTADDYMNNPFFSYQISQQVYIASNGILLSGRTENLEGQFSNAPEQTLTLAFFPTGGAQQVRALQVRYVVDDADTSKYHYELLDEELAATVLEIDQDGVWKYPLAPTSEPATANQIWNSDGILRLSQTGNGIVFVPSFVLAGDQVVGALPISIPSPEDGAIYEVALYATTGPVGDDLIVDVYLNGVTIFSGAKPQINDGVQGSFGNTPTTTAISENDVLTVAVTQVGSTTPGSDLTIEIRCRK
jgi:hypothetical protein